MSLTACSTNAARRVRKPSKLWHVMLALPLLALAIAVATPAPAHAEADPRAYVATLGEEAIGVLGDKSLTQDQMESKFRSLLLDALDSRRVGLFARGQYARLPTAEQKEAYFDLLGDFIVEVYLGRLTGYSNEQFVVTGSQEKGKKGREVIVASQIRFADGREPLKVEWWLIRGKEGDLRVFDVNVAGIWMAQEQRGTFTSHIRNNGGKFDSLLDHLRHQAGQASSGQNTADAG